MDAVQRRGSPERLSYIKRLGCVILAFLLCFSLMAPPMVQAVAVVDDIFIAALITVAVSAGVSFVVESDFTTWISQKIDSFFHATAQTVVDLFSEATRARYEKTGELVLAQNEVAAMSRFFSFLASEDVITTPDGYKFFVYDGGHYYQSYPSADHFVTITSFPHYVSTASNVYFDIASVNGSDRVCVYIGGKIACFFAAYTGQVVTYVLQPYISSSSICCLGAVSVGGGCSTIIARKIGAPASTPGSLDLYNFCMSIMELYNSYDWSSTGGAIATPPVTDVIDGMEDDDLYYCPDVVGWDASNVAGSADRVITGMQEGTLSVTGTVTKATDVPAVGEMVGDISLDDVQESEGRLKPLFLRKFPFSIPWDMYLAVKLLAAPPETPYWESDFLAPLAQKYGWQGSTKIVIDFGDYEIVGTACRWFSTLLFLAALMMGTKRLIWTGGG